MIDATHERLEATIALLDRLVAFDTESAKSNLDLVAFVEAYLSSIGVMSVRLPSAEGDKAALFATVGPARDGGVVLSCHSDVVPVAGQAWSADPFRLRREGGRLTARGACDMKGFLAACLAMMETFARAPLSAPVHLLMSYDEETTCLGPLDAIARFGAGFPRPGAVIVGEPTLMQVADAHKSVAAYTTTVFGRAAHSSNPALGANAIDGACALVADLAAFADELREQGDASGRFDPAASTVSVGLIEGGTARNILAERCAFHWEFRGLPDSAPDVALRRLDDAARERVLPRMRVHAPESRVETSADVEVPGLAPEPDSRALTLGLRLTRSNHAIAVSYATEAGRFQAAGVPTIVCGPGDIAQAHQPDEFITEAQLVACLRFLDALSLEL